MSRISDRRAQGLPEPADQAGIPHPRIGFYGVLDERLDRALAGRGRRPAAGLAVRDDRPGGEDRADEMPRRPNIHYLGAEILPRAARLLSALGRGDDAVRAATRRRGSSARRRRPSISRAAARWSRRRSRMSCGNGANTGSSRSPRRRRRSSTRPRDAWPWRRPAWLPETDKMLEACPGTDLGAHARPDRERGPTGIADRRAPGQGPHARARYDDLVVGAGFAGAVMAERLAAASGRRVLVVDRRPHIGGNAYDYPDAAGVLVHRTGRTSSTPTPDGPGLPLPIHRMAAVRAPRAGARSKASCCRYRSTARR